MKMSKFAPVLTAFVLSSVSALASASTFVDASSTTSQVASAVTVDLGTTPTCAVSLNCNAPVVGDTVFSDGFATFTDGVLSTSTSSLGHSVAGGDGAFWSVYSGEEHGLNLTPNGPGALTFASGVAYVGFLWGSPDLYNTVTFWSNGTQLASFNGSAAAPASQLGNAGFSSYFNFYADGSDLITSVTFSSTGIAFETDNFAYSVTAVPEPGSYAMMLAGLGLMGVIARRRNKGKSA